MTRAEHIRQMTDEEIAEWFAPHMQCKICPLKGRYGGCDVEDCKKGALEWLRQESALGRTEGSAEE